MKKTSVYLSDEEIERLGRLAAADDVSMAEVIRRAIRSYVPRRGRDRDFALTGVAEGPGDSIVDIADEELLEGFGE